MNGSPQLGDGRRGRVSPIVRRDDDTLEEDWRPADDDTNDDPRDEDMDAEDDDEPSAFCPECRRPLCQDADYCPGCGAYVTPTSDPAGNAAGSIRAFVIAGVLIALMLALVLPIRGLGCH